MNNNVFQIRNALTFPNKNLRIKKMLINTTELQTVWDNCLGYSALQLSIRTSNDIILHIDYSDDHINNTATSHNTSYSFAIDTGAYKYYSVPIKGNLVRLRVEIVNTVPDPLNDSLLIKAQYSMSSHYILC